MRTSPSFRRFIELDMNFPQSVYTEAKKIAFMQDLQKGGRDFIYLPQYQTIFVAMSDMNLATRLDSYFTNMTMPWEKKDKTQKKSVLREDAVATVGALQHFRIQIEQGEKNNKWRASPTWAKTYASQTNILHWCDEQSILYCGLDSGLIMRYKCSKDKYLIQMEELSELTVHNAQMRIMGISIDPRVNHMFSISESGYLIVTDLNDTKMEGGKFINSQCLNNETGLKAMIHDTQRNILFVASGSGEVFLLNSLPTQPELIIKLKTD